MHIIGFFGVAMVIVGAAMLIMPGVARFVIRYGLGVTLTTHPASRIAAWGLVILGVFVVAMARLVA